MGKHLYFKETSLRVATLAFKEKVYTQVVKNCSAKELLPILRGFSDHISESVIYSDCWKAYIDYGAKEHFMVKHSKSEFANDKFHINEIVNFFTLFACNFERRGYAKHILSKFKG